MKKIFGFVAGILMMAGFAHAQEIVIKNGMYYKGDQLFTGKYTEFYSSGALKTEMNVVEGREDGLVMIYFQNGEKKEQRSFKMGLKDGTWYTWDETQHLTAEASFKNDLKHGHWYVWDPDGTKRYEMYYENGEKREPGISGTKTETLRWKGNIRDCFFG